MEFLLRIDDLAKGGTTKELWHQTYHNNTNGTWVNYYSCAHDGTGVLKEYTKKFPERERKVPSK